MPLPQMRGELGQMDVGRLWLDMIAKAWDEIRVVKVELVESAGHWLSEL